ncbi:hypothetical protein ES703_104665 [subsurface metagenome]
MTTAAMMTAATTKAGIRSFFTPKVTVISLEVMGFFSGTILSVVGIPFSIAISSERTSPGL